MVANLWLLTCALVAAQPTSAWLLMPRLTRGQELVYRGTISEEALNSGVQFNRSYRLESRVFVLKSSPQSTDVAFYTIIKQRTGTERPQASDIGSARLELGHVNPQGRVTADPGLSMAIPLDGPATWECGAFVEFPKGAVGLNETWEVTEENRPVRIWRVVGTEVIGGMNCAKLHGLQQTADWDRPRADRAAWRRQDTVWVATRLGVACKVERIMERREPGHKEATQRSLVRYELHSDMQYPGELFEYRKRDILQARAFSDALAPLLPNPSQHGSRPFDVIEKRINYHLNNQPPTPYREAILQVKRRVEAAQRGESPPAVPSAESGFTPTPCTVGQQAPDFLVTNLLTKQSAQLRLFVGRPILLLFYSPQSATVGHVLRFVQAEQDQNGQRLTVLGLAMSDDAQAVRRQHSDLKLSFPILSGNGLGHSYAVEATPKLVVIDAAGIIRGSYVGWGPETALTVAEEIKHWIRVDGLPKSGSGR